MKRFRNILCVVEPAASSKAAVMQAAALAKSNQAKLSVVSVVKKPGLAAIFGKGKAQLDDVFKEMVQTKKQELERLVKLHCQKVEAEVSIYTGIEFIEVIRDVLRNKRDLVVKCCSGEDWVDRLFGSDDMQLLRKCPCPVLMLKQEHTKPFSNILATVDLMDDNVEEGKEARVQQQLNQAVLDYAVVFALTESADLHIGSVWEAYGENFLRHGAFSKLPDDDVDQYVEQRRLDYADKLDDLGHKLKSLAGDDAIDYVKPRTHLVKGQASREIPLMISEYNIDLIVMGTVARTGIPGIIIGNTAEAVLEQVGCSVLAIKPDGFHTPVTLAE